MDRHPPGAAALDVSFLKDTRIRERVTIQFRTEFFNFLNHANMESPGASQLQITNKAFGQITGASRPREVQFALKLIL